MIMRASTVVSAAALIVATATATASPLEQRALCFSTIGDWGRSESFQAQVGAGMAKRAQDENCDFIISNGDNFYGAGVTSTSDPLWKQAYEDIYTQPSLQKQWAVSVGNHDYGHGWAGIQAQIDYTNKTGNSRWFFPSNYWSDMNRAGMVDFVYIDTVNFTTTQQSWLQSTLAASKAPYLHVVGHYPVYSGGSHGSVMQGTPLQSMLEAAKASVYSCGHDHDLQHLESNGVTYFVSGGGSTDRDDGGDLPETKWHTGTSGTVMCEVWASNMTCSFGDMHGTVMHSAAVMPRATDAASLEARRAAVMAVELSEHDMVVVSDEDESSMDELEAALRADAASDAVFVRKPPQAMQ